MTNFALKRVFIVGAGFSKSVGMPDANELTDRLLASKTIRDFTELQSWAKGLRKRIAILDRNCLATYPVEVEGEEHRVSIERFFDYATYDIQLFDLRQQTQSCNIGDTPSNAANRVRGYLRALNARLPRVLIEAQESCKDRLDVVEKVVQQLNRGDTVLTFNYDTVLERAFEHEETSWWHGFNEEPVRDVTILKLHGSIDWLLVRRDDQDGCQRLFQLNQEGISFDLTVQNHDCAKRMLDTVLVRSPNPTATFDKLNRQVITENRVGPPDQPAEFGIASLGAHKPLDRLIGSGHVWTEALTALKNAQEIYVIGWSASPYDAMARYNFATVIARRATPPGRVVVVDPNAESQRENYVSVFGNKIDKIAKKVEEVDWSLILGR